MYVYGKKGNQTVNAEPMFPAEISNMWTLLLLAGQFMKTLKLSDFWSTYETVSVCKAQVRSMMNRFRQTKNFT